MGGQVPAAVVQERYERLIALVEETSLDGNAAFVGRQVEVLVADGEGRKDDVTHRMSGRARDNRLVHFTPGSSAGGSGGSSPRESSVGGSGGSSPRESSVGGSGGPPPRDSRVPRPGDIVTTVVTRAAPHYLIADGEPLAVRPTRGADAWAARRDSAREGSAAATPGRDSRGGVLLGMPALSRPA